MGLAGFPLRHLCRFAQRLIVGDLPHENPRRAEAAVAAGECVIIYPEGTCTRDPDGWPMVARTGVARLVLSGDAPVIPVAHWGTQRMLPYKSKRPKLLPPKQPRVSNGNGDQANIA